MNWARRVVATKTFKVLFVAIIAVVILAAIFAEDPSNDPDLLSGTPTVTTDRSPNTVRVISTTTPTIVVSPTDTHLPPIEHPPPPPRTTRRAPPPPPPSPSSPPPVAASGGSPVDCAARADVVSLFIEGVLELTDLLEFQVLVGDLVGAQESYDTIGWVMRDWGEISDALQRDCRGLAPAAAAQARSGMDGMIAGWRELQRICRAELAPLGFNC